MCAEPIFFREDGTIVEARMTSQGSSSPIDASRKVDASLACRMKLPWYEGRECRVEVRIENNQVIACCEIRDTGSWDEWQEFSCELTEDVNGVHPVWLHFEGTNGQCRLADVDWFSFS